MVSEKNDKHKSFSFPTTHHSSPTTHNRTGVLYLVATPIGNLADLSFRAVETLKAADLVACEDTRHSKVLLDHYGIKKPMVSYHDFSERRRAPQILEKLKSGASVALVSDAGTPGIADPGYRVVKLALEAGVRVEAVPGPSAMLAALAVSGLPTDRFAFEGFFPVKDGARRTRLRSWKEADRTMIAYESPHRLLKTLEAMKEELGDVHVVVARELTKKFEEVTRGTVGEALARYSTGKILGEFVLLYHPDGGVAVAREEEE